MTSGGSWLRGLETFSTTLWWWWCHRSKKQKEVRTSMAERESGE
jgi:tRNA (Thr-GGU) A37 N-methylase